MATGDAQQMLQAGIKAARAGNRAQARQLLARAVGQDPSSEQGWLWLAGVMDNPEEIIYCLEQALVLNPHNDSARQGIAWARQRLTAAAPAQPVTTTSPPTSPASPIRAPAVSTKDPPPEAASSTLRAVLSPPRPENLAFRAEEDHETLAARLAAGKASLPKWETRGLASLRSLETVDEMVARGKSILDQGRVDEAAGIFRGAIARQPDHAEAHAQLGVVYYHLGDKRGALVELENVVAIAPGYVEAHFSLGTVYAELGETKAAVHCWERVLELDPDHAEARLQLERARATESSRYECPDCGTVLSGLEPACPRCGKVFFVRCTNCGEYVEEKAENCPRCGSRLRGAEPAPSDAAPEEVRGPQIACLHCGSLNPAYHTRCVICGAPIGDAVAAASAAAFPRSRRRVRFTWLFIALLSWIAACGLCLWGLYAGYQIVPLADLGTTDPMGVAGDLLTRRVNDSLLVVATLGAGLLLGFVGRIGWRLARS